MSDSDQAPQYRVLNERDHGACTWRPPALLQMFTAEPAPPQTMTLRMVCPLCAFLFVVEVTRPTW